MKRMRSIGDGRVDDVNIYMADNTLDLMDDDTVSISECRRKNSIDYILIVVVLDNGVYS